MRENSPFSEKSTVLMRFTIVTIFEHVCFIWANIQHPMRVLKSTERDLKAKERRQKRG